MSKISQLIDEIASEREKIWQNAPSELEPLKSRQKGRAGNVAVRVYAFADAYRNQRNLWLLRESVKTQNLTIEIAKLVLAPFLKEMADRLEAAHPGAPITAQVRSVVDQVEASGGG